MLRHIVFWKIKDNEDKEHNMERMIKMLYSLDGKIKGLESIELGYNFDQSSEYDVVLYTMFKSPAALKFYQNHPEHIKCKEFISTITEKRISVDYVPEDPEFFEFESETPVIEEQSSKESIESKKNDETVEHIETKVAKASDEETKTVEETQTIEETQAVEETNTVEVNPQIESNELVKNTVMSDIQTSTVDDYQSLVRPIIPGINAPIDFVPPEEPEDNYSIIPEIVQKSIKETQEDYDILESIVDDESDSYAPNSDDSDTKIMTSETMTDTVSSIELDKPEEVNIKSVEKTAEPLARPAEDKSVMPFAKMKGVDEPTKVEDKSESVAKPLNAIPTTKPNTENLNSMVKEPEKDESLLKPAETTKPIKPSEPVIPAVPTTSKTPKKSRFFGAKKVQDEEPKEIDMSNKWKCPSCGRINANYVGTCGCGECKPFEAPAEQPQTVKAEIKEEIESNAWKCPRCGLLHSNFITDCKCGYINNGFSVNPISDSDSSPDFRKESELPPIAPMKASDILSDSNNFNGSVSAPKPVEIEVSSVNANDVKGLEFGKRRNNIPISTSEKKSVSMDTTSQPVISKPEKKSFFGRKKKTEEVKEEVDMTKFWKCPSCGKLNYNYVGTCGCGESKPFVFDFGDDETEEVTTSSKSNAWKCPKCDRLNSNFVTSCLCGYDNTMQ